MPGGVAASGAAQLVLPLAGIADALTALVVGPDREKQDTAGASRTDERAPRCRFL
jgi:ribosomal protein S5